MAHFYLVDPALTIVVGSHIVLDGAEGRHAATVSRIRVGEAIRVGNGVGAIGHGTVVNALKDSLVIRVESVEVVTATTPEIVLVQALAKTDRDERAVEMSTELGVDRIVPWMAERSVSRWDDSKAEKGRQKWQAIAREASKQSIRAFVPQIDALSTTTQLLRDFLPESILVLDPTGTQSLSSVPLSSGSIVVIVGPEGGLSSRELEQLRIHGAHIVTVGSNILRTSTAGPAALAVLNSRLGRL
jgi:16S rRNA (uracil1498-N3)-methyltransferase